MSDIFPSVEEVLALDAKYKENRATTQENIDTKSNLRRGWESGWDQTQGMLYGSVGLAGDLLGSDGMRDFGYEGYQRNMEEASLNPVDVQRFSDIDSAGEAVSWTAGTIGQLAPSAIEALGSALLGGGAAGLVARKAGKEAIEAAVKNQVRKGISREVAEGIVANDVKRLGTQAGIVAGVGALESGGMYGEDADKHGIENANAASALALGLVSGGSEIISPMGKVVSAISGVKRYGSKVANEVADSALKRIASRGAHGATGEFGQEVFQEFLGKVNERINDPNVSLTDKKAMIDYLDAGAAGAIGGIGFGQFTPTEVEVVRKAKEQWDNAENVDDVLESAKVLGKAGERILPKDVPAQVAPETTVPENRPEVEIPETVQEVLETGAPVQAEPTTAPKIPSVARQESAEQITPEPSPEVAQVVAPTQDSVDAPKSQVIEPQPQQVAPGGEAVATEKKPWEMTSEEFFEEYTFHGSPREFDELRPGSYFSDFNYAKGYARKPGAGPGTGYMYAVRKSDIVPMSADEHDLFGQSELETGASLRSGITHSPVRVKSFSPHKMLVRDALLGGKIIPKEVLAEYQDLAKQTKIPNNNTPDVTVQEDGYSDLKNSINSTPSNPRQELTERHGSLITGMEQSGELTILSSQEEAAGITGETRSADSGKTQGFVKDGKVYLVADAIPQGHAHNVMVHEVGVHLNKLSSSDKAFKAIADHAFSRSNAVVRKARARAESAGVAPEHMAEETLAYIVEEAPDSNFARRIIARVKQMLTETFGPRFAKLMNEKDLRALAEIALRKGRKVNPGADTDVATKESGVNEFAQDVKKSVAEAKRVIQNLPAFKKWFAGSKVVDEKGEPLVVYHGSPEQFSIFDNERVGRNTGSPMAGLGHFFAKDKNEAMGYTGGTGNVGSFYIKIENPYRTTSSALGSKLMTPQKVKQLKLRLEVQGYDGVIFEDEGHVIAFDNKQIKAIQNQSWDGSNPDVMKSVAAPTVEETTDNDIYAQNRALKTDYVKRAKTEVGNIFKDMGAGLDKAFGAISTRLGKVHQSLKNHIRKLDFNTSRAQQKDFDKVNPFLMGMKKMSKADRMDIDLALKNGAIDKINEIVGRYGLEQEYADAREMMDGVLARAKEVGVDIGYLEHYWPRILSKQREYLAFMKKGKDWPLYTKEFEAKEKQIGRSLTDEEKADIINNIILGTYSGSALHKPGHAKKRSIEEVNGELNQFYMDSSAAMVDYIYKMNRLIENRKFFGKIPENIQKHKRQLNKALTDKAKLEKQLAQSQVESEQEALRKKIWWKVADIKKSEAYLEDAKYNYDFTESIGAYVLEQTAKGRITKDTERQVVEILTARFNEHGTRGLIGLYKNLSYLETMGNPFSALTQIGDWSLAAYFGGFVNAGKALTNAAFKKSRITREDVGLTHMAQEFADYGSAANAVSWVFKKVGLDYMDAVGKEGVMNAAIAKYAAMPEGRLRKELQPILEGETEATIKDLKAGHISENVKYLGWYTLSEAQPIALSEMSQLYLGAGNGRIFFMLKSYTIKLWDVQRNIAFGKMFGKGKSKAERIEGFQNLMKLAFVLVLANAGADEIKDFILGRKTDWEDRVVDNILRLGGGSKFVAWRARTDGLGKAVASQILPPFRFIDSAYKDIVKGGEDGLEIVQSVPMVGKLWYWRMGKGTTKRKTLAEIRYSKEKKKLKDAWEGLESAKDKQAYIREHRDEIRRYKQGNKLQYKLNRLTSTINKLKAQDNKKTRLQIQKLEARRQKMMEGFIG